MVSAGLGALTALAAFPGIWEPRNRSRAAVRRAAVHAERPPAARRRWRPSWAIMRGEASKIARDAWRVVRVPSFLVLLAEHVTDLTGGVSGFAVQYFQARAWAHACGCLAWHREPLLQHPGSLCCCQVEHVTLQLARSIGIVIYYIFSCPHMLVTHPVLLVAEYYATTSS